MDATSNASGAAFAACRLRANLRGSGESEDSESAHNAERNRHAHKIPRGKSAHSASEPGFILHTLLLNIIHRILSLHFGFGGVFPPSDTSP